jgi:uncharacterized protein YecE (DUF72 family)
MPKIYVGTSGYSYPHWSDGVFYPKGLTQNKWLQYYAQFFNSVELNVSFYRLPSKKTFEGWRKKTPKNFYFVVKGSRFITHIKKLNDCRDSLRIFFENASGLKGKLAAVLWQMPPGLKKDKQRLENFLKLLKDKRYPPKLIHAFEFRHRSWFGEDICSLLRRYKMALCVAHSERWPVVKKVTSDSVYLRFHGGRALYGSNYSEEELKEWAGFASSCLKKGKDLFAFFNNDAYGFAVKNALRFKELVEK